MIEEAQLIGCRAGFREYDDWETTAMFLWLRGL